MKMRVFSTVLFILLVLGFMAQANAFAGAADIKQRMLERLPTILALKNDGIVGENNSGYLEYLTDKKPKQEVVAAENADRRRVYQAIAEQQGTTAEVVGARRAMQIAQTAQPGEWLQDPGGNWYQKK
ncbi:MAG: YdbL family protein [Desulfobacterales bacterium]